MKWSVYYRDKSGQQTTLIVEAESKSALFAELKKRGISAIRVEQADSKAKPGKVGAKAPGAKSPAIAKGIVAGLVVVGLAIAAFYFLMPGDAPVKKPPKPTPKAEEPSEPTRIPAKPAKVEEEPIKYVTNRHGRVVQKKKPETYIDERGVERYKKGNGRVPLEHPEKYLVKSIVHPNAYPDFKHDSENEIANLLTIESGGMIFGDREYDKRFEQDFLQALMEPIEINEDDSENDRMIKENVEAAKKEIAARIKNGENLRDILTAEREEIRRLANYKQQMQEIFHEQIASGEIRTEEDLDTYCQAVNRMLESKGIEPIKISGLMRRRFRLDSAKTK